jgi:hypothetical protein
MDNIKQIEEILKYYKYLVKIIGKDIDINLAARIWIRKFAKIWRLQHPVLTHSKPR